MKAYAYDKNGNYTGEVDCQINPLEPGKFLIPAMATLIKPLEEVENKDNSFNGLEWVYIDSKEFILNKELEEKEVIEAAKLALNTKLSESNDQGILLYELDGIDSYKERDANVVRAESLAAVRALRNIKLSECDYLVLPDSDISESSLLLIVEYRKQLRDLPNDENFDPFNFEYPVKPDVQKSGE